MRFHHTLDFPRVACGRASADIGSGKLGWVNPRVRTWASRAALILAALAVLATSKPEGWSVEATIVGPRKARAGSALRLEIESSKDVEILTTGTPGSYQDKRVTPCLVPWIGVTKRICVLPPAATIDKIVITGDCGGSRSGCPPPKGSFVNVTSSEVPYWTDTVTSTMSATLPSHGPKFIASFFVVEVDGAPAATVKLVVSDAASGAHIYTEEQACSIHAGSGTLATCRLIVYDDLVKPSRAVKVVAEATGWGECATGATSPCAPPKTLGIRSLRID